MPPASVGTLRGILGARWERLKFHREAPPHLNWYGPSHREALLRALEAQAREARAAGETAIEMGILLVSCSLCGNHKENLIEEAGMAAAGTSVYNLMFAGSAFLKMGGNFVRLLHATQHVIDRDMMVPIAGDPPPGAQRIAAELRDYATKNYKGFLFAQGADDSWSSDSDSTESAARRKGPKGSAAGDCRRRQWLYQKSWDDFLAIYNGVIWHKDATVGPHYLSEDSPYMGNDLCSLKRSAARVTNLLLFRAAPQRPLKGKWTKKGQCLDFHALCRDNGYAWPHVEASVR